MNILIIRFSSLCDLVTLEPTFRAIRHFYKKDHITFVTTGIGKGLYQDSDYFDDYIIHTNLFDTIKSIPKKRFDLVINLQCNKPSHYINLFLKKDKTVNKSFNLIQKILKIKTPSKSPEELLVACGIEKNDVYSYFKKNTHTNLPYKENIDIKNNIYSKFKNLKIIAISTGSSQKWVSKKWPKEKYRNLILKLKDQFGIVLVGSELEKEDEAFILKDCKEYIISYVDKTDLNELKNILKIVDLYIGNDSGPSHIAAGVGTPTITIFGSTDIKHCVSFQQYDGTHMYIKPSESIKCHPCYKAKCPTKHECMEDITVEQVLFLVDKLENEK